MQVYDIIVVGGGAAGMLASATAAENGARVLLLERNAGPGKKLRITGKGRCNLTNNCSITEAIENIPNGGKFLHSAFALHGPGDTMQLFEKLGVPLKTERGGRVFPQSDKASDIVAALGAYMDKAGVERARGRAVALQTEAGRFVGNKPERGLELMPGNAPERGLELMRGRLPENMPKHTLERKPGNTPERAQENTPGHTPEREQEHILPRVTGVTYDGGEARCGAVILATGGLSYPATGSTGDGYEMAAALGHKVTPLRGSLVPLDAESDICGAMQGLTLKNVKLSAYGAGPTPIFEDIGEVLFTHFGLSGPLTLSASAHMRDFDKTKYHVIIDFKPGLDEKKLDLRILRDFEKYSNRDFANSLDDLLSKSCIPVVVRKSGIPPHTKVHSIIREQRLRLVELLKSFRIDVIGPRPVEEAIITSGGVDLREINPKTMESKLVGGLFFAGEIIDADAYTGGFNLQIAWSTAFAAANAAAAAVIGGRTQPLR
ncbi:MAG: NAD(P)/FAD-dependent oxidoreductase [Oscillospiraceae bacterium]|nr:NAD(P)/FAD-dependent oxidoreductase [Oscillospiraceae bacterium]